MPSRLFRDATYWTRWFDFSLHVQDHHPVFHNPDFEAFTGLKELGLYGLFGDLPSWCHKIVTIAVSCPQLEKLGLSHGCDTQKLTGFYYDSQPINFFDDICNQYEETGAAPLRLKTLRFGEGGLLTGGIYTISKLTDVTFLEELKTHDDFNSELWHPQQIAETFTKARLPRLRRLIVPWVSYGLMEHLKSELAEGLSQQLALIASTSEPGGPGYVNPAKLRMTSFLPEDGAFPGDSASQLAGLADSCGDLLEGLAFYTGDAPFLAAETKFVIDSLVGVASKLVRLTQIYIALSDGWCEADKHNDVCLEYDATYCADLARRLVRAAPQLRYLCIRGVFWEARKSVDDTVELIEFEREEWRHVELFKMVTEAGGLGWVGWDDLDVLES